MIFKSIDKVSNLQRLCFKIKEIIILNEISKFHFVFKIPMHFKVINESMITIVLSLNNNT